MDPAALAARIEAIDGRLAGTDAERRAAALCAAELRSAGRAPRVQTLWFRPRRDAVRALHAAIGVAGSVAAVHHATVGLSLAGGALALSLLDAAGLPLAALLLARRATQNVVAAPIDDPPGTVRLVLATSVDAPPAGALAWLVRHLRGPAVPGVAGMLDLALLLVAGFAAARVAGAGGTALSAFQLVPTVVLILLFAGFLEAALSARAAPGPGGAGAAVALATAAALDARPPRRLAIEVLIAGAGEAGSPGMSAYVRARRKGLAPEDIVVLHLRAGHDGLHYVVRDGERLPLRLHPRLVELAGALPHSVAREGRGRSIARVARGARWPALTLEGDAPTLAEATLRLVAAIDAEVATTAAARRR